MDRTATVLYKAHVIDKTVQTFLGTHHLLWGWGLQKRGRSAKSFSHAEGGTKSFEVVLTWEL